MMRPRLATSGASSAAIRRGQQTPLATPVIACRTECCEISNAEIANSYVATTTTAVTGIDGAIAIGMTKR